MTENPEHNMPEKGPRLSQREAEKAELASLRKELAEIVRADVKDFMGKSGSGRREVGLGHSELEKKEEALLSRIAELEANRSKSEK